MAKYTLTIGDAYPPYDTEYVIVVEAESEEEARAKGGQWLVRHRYVMFVEEIEVTKEMLGDDPRAKSVTFVNLTASQDSSERK